MTAKLMAIGVPSAAIVEFGESNAQRISALQRYPHFILNHRTLIDSYCCPNGIQKKCGKRLRINHLPQPRRLYGESYVHTRTGVNRSP
jgi:hypothetical protein